MRSRSGSWLNVLQDSDLPIYRADMQWRFVESINKNERSRASIDVGFVGGLTFQSAMNNSRACVVVAYRNGL